MSVSRGKSIPRGFAGDAAKAEHPQGVKVPDGCLPGSGAGRVTLWEKNRARPAGQLPGPSCDSATSSPPWPRAQFSE